jgi:RNA polymerase sigma-70 factor (ECF subfamily)
MSAADEQHLILQTKEGSHEAFRILVRRYMKEAYNVAYGFVRNHDDADDVAQEAFVRVFQSIRSFRGDAEFSTWLHRIVVNLSLNRVKKQKKKKTTESDINEMSQLAAAPAGHSRDLRQHIERALYDLPTLQRAVVILRHFEGMSTRQASRILRCSEGSIKTHLHRGLKKMKEHLGYLKEEMV